MILVFGSVNIDLVAEADAIPRPGETVLCPSYATAFGGKGANQAVAAARVAGPGRVAMAARIGADAFGEACRANLAANGVGVAAVSTADAPTGCAFITVDRAGDNAITVASGANARLAADDVPAELITAETVGVFQMEVPFPASLAAARRLRAAGARVVWNLAPMPGALTRDDLRSILAVTDCLVVNAGEAEAALALLDAAVPEPRGRAERLAAHAGTTCIVTDGARGASIAEVEREAWHCPATTVQVVDTTGAGDTFVGILAAMIHEGRPLREAVGLACAGASLACRAVGAQAAMPDRALLLARGSPG